jgi:CDP-glycerol glycerophosphotransferase
VLAARLFLFTHVVHRGPRPRGRRLVVNLWHGDGPKVTVPQQHRRPFPSSHVVVSGTRTWGEAKAAAFHLAPKDVWVTGNPRIDEMSCPADDAALRSLGLDPDLPVVLWAPTFRQVSHDGARDWADSADVLPFDDLLRRRDGVFAQLARQGLQVVVKPHPMDAADYRTDGLTTLSDRQLEDAGTDLYRFMARCRALITDYSSIWTDFAVLDRPIVLFCPDLEHYRAGRGFSDGAISGYAPGPLLSTETELLDALRRIAAGEDVGRDLRRRSCAVLGVSLDPGATDRLLSHVRTALPGPRHSAAGRRTALAGDPAGPGRGALVEERA